MGVSGGKPILQMPKLCPPAVSKQRAVCSRVVGPESLGSTGYKQLNSCP